MARERISDIWGGTSSPWEDMIRLPLVRRILAVLVAVPLSAIGFAIADNPSTPGATRLLVAPGYVVAFHLPIYAYNPGFLGNIGRLATAALAINVCYYTSLLLGLMRFWSAAKRNKRLHRCRIGPQAPAKATGRSVSCLNPSQARICPSGFSSRQSAQCADNTGRLSCPQGRRLGALR